MTDRAPSSTRSNWGGPPAALGAIVAGAVALRLVGIQYGLPYGSILDPDEQNVVPRAWRMVHGGGADPRFFDWPTLVMYAEAPFQWFYDAPSYLAGRFVVVAFAGAGVALAWWLGSRAYGTVAGAVAAAFVAVDTTHVAASHAAVTDIPLTTLTTLALGLLVVGRIELAGIAIGLAAAAKYPGVVLVVPLVVVAWKKWRALAVSLVLAVAAFFAASPYVFLRAGDAWSDIHRIEAQHRRGWLGFEHDDWSGIAFVHRLWDGLGPVLVISLAGLVLALAQRRFRADLALGSFVVAYYLTLLPLHSHFPRYVLPLVPPLGALAGRLRGVAPVTLLLLVVPFTWAVRDDVTLTHTDTRVVAARWIDAHVPKGAVVAADPSTAVPPGYRVVPLQLPLPGLRDPNRNVERLKGDWILVTGAVADRVRAARNDYPNATQFYDALVGSRFRVEAHDGIAGPWTAVYPP